MVGGEEELDSHAKKCRLHPVGKGKSLEDVSVGKNDGDCAILLGQQKKQWNGQEWRQEDL